MGDTTNLELAVRGVKQPAVLKAIRALFLGFAGDYSYNLYSDSTTATSLMLGANEVSVGTVEELDDALGELLLQGLEYELCDYRSDQYSHACVLPYEHEGDHDMVPESDTERFNGRMPVEDFAWWVNDDPKYEWLGTLRIHVPGFAPFSADCDANGAPIINAAVVMSRINAATDLDQLKRDIQLYTGSEIIAAFNAIEED